MSLRFAAILCLTTCGLFGLSGPTRAQDAEAKNVWDRAIRSVALVFAAEPDKDQPFVAGAVLLDRHERMLLTTAAGLPDQVRAMFAEYTDNGTLRNSVAEYRERAQTNGRSGKVLHRDKSRNLAVVQLEKPLPESCLWIELAAERSRPGDRVYRVGGATPKDAWVLSEGQVRSVAVERDMLGGVEVNAQMLSTTAMPEIAPAGPVCDRAGRMVAFPTFNSPRAWNVSKHLDMSEVRAFLKDEKVPFMEAPKEAADPEGQLRTNRALKSMAYVAVTAKDGKVTRETCGVVLGREQGFLLTADLGAEARAVSVVFPEYRKDGQLLNDPRRYREAIARKTAATATVAVRDRRRDIALLRLDKPCPAGVTAMTVADPGPKVGEPLWRVGFVDADSGLWQGAKCIVRMLDKRPVYDIATGADHGELRGIVVNLGLKRSDGVLVNASGELGGLGVPTKRERVTGGGAILQFGFQHLHVSEIRTFLDENNIKLPAKPTSRK